MIEKAAYNKVGEISFLLDGDLTTIPDDFGNSYRRLLAEWEADGNTIAPYVEPPKPVPDEISRRQFFQQLANDEIISRDEALAALQTGVIPSPLLAIINALPDEDSRFSAKMLVIGASVFNRTNPLSEIVRQSLNWTVARRDSFWADASAL